MIIGTFLGILKRFLAHNNLDCWLIGLVIIGIRKITLNTRKKVSNKNQKCDHKIGRVKRKFIYLHCWDVHEDSSIQTNGNQARVDE